MIDIILKMLLVYVVGYILTLILIALGESEDKAPNLKSKLEWGIFFSIVWPVTLPIFLSCACAYLGKQFSKLFAKFKN
jgi:hypothetical protein